MERVLKDNASKLTVTFYQDGTAADLDAVPTVTITDANGTTVTSGNATDEPGVGVYSFTLPAQAQLKLLTVQWDGAFVGNDAQIATYVEIVGGVYFTLSELAAQDGCAGKTAAQYVEARNIVETTIEDYCGVAFVPRYAREVHDGNGNSVLLLRKAWARSLIAVTVNGTAQTTTGWTVDPVGWLRTGATTFAAGVAGQNVVVEYTHGLPAPPAYLKRAALRCARHVLLTEVATVPDRANLMTTEWGTFRLQTADEDRDRPTGLPEIDAALNRAKDEWGGEVRVFAG